MWLYFEENKKLQKIIRKRVKRKILLYHHKKLNEKKKIKKKLSRKTRILLKIDPAKLAKITKREKVFFCVIKWTNMFQK